MFNKAALLVGRVTKSENFPDSKIFVAKNFWIKSIFKFATNVHKRWFCKILCIRSKYAP